MVNYQCYRCGYTTTDKSRMNRHISRTNTCDAKISNIKLDDVKEYILSGISYIEYCENEMSIKSKSKVSLKVSLKSAKSKSKVSLKSAKSKSKVSPNANLKSAKSKYLCNNLEDDAKYTCKYCENIYMHKQSLFKHLKTCKEKKKDETVKESMEELVKLLNEKEKQLKESEKEKEKQLKESEKEKEKQLKESEKKDKQLAKILSDKDKQLMDELKKRDKQIEELIKKAGIVNSNNVTNNIQNNFKLLNYKETDTSHLTENDYVKCLEHYNFCVPHLIRKIHFNPKKPENHNIYISNLKNSYVMIYINNKWKVKNRDETISRMIDDKQIILEKKIQEWVESGIQYPKVMAKFSRYIEKREENDVINAIKEDIKLMLYNNRNMIIENNKRLIK